MLLASPASGQARQAILISLMGLMGLTGCISHHLQRYEGSSLTTPSRPCRPTPESRALFADRQDRQWQRQEAAVPWLLQRSTHTAEIWLLEGSPSRGEVVATYYRARMPGTHRLVIVLPIWGRSTVPQRNLAKKLLAGPSGARTHVVALHGGVTIFDWELLHRARDGDDLRSALEEAEGQFVQRVVDIRRLLDWAEARPEVDARRIGMTGFSIGAVVTTLVMAHDDRVAAAALVVPAGHLSESLANCNGRTGKNRQQILDHLGWSQNRFQDFVREPLAAVDPLRYAGALPTGRILLVDAANDLCVPPRSQGELWRRLGQPERLVLDYGHRMSFLTMTPLGFHITTRAVARFLEQQLGE